MWRRYQIPLFLSLLLLLIVGFVLVRPGMRTEELVSAQSAMSLSCEVFCSDTRIGVSVAEVTFSGDASSLNQLVLEVTVYKNGFEISLVIGKCHALLVSTAQTVLNSDQQAVLSLYELRR